ncbi:HesA/MoeB/ThiF family protein [Microbacterium sp.]|uniref:HesA/MoeB/ThiF family protein n=1 Tax=Microbacterium sp. TaxID=51671 RepID=UPI003C7400C4
MTDQAALVEPGPELRAEERIRYARQLALPEIGAIGQRRLRRARVLVVGAGGLGSPVLTALAGAGVGTIGIVDDDVVDVGNLHRQTIHAGSAPGTAKTASVGAAIRELNPLVQVEEIPQRLTAENAAALLDGYDIVVDGADTFATHAAVTAAAERRGIPVVWGSALGMDGQVTIFEPYARGGVGLGDLYPSLPADQPGGACQVVGILGPVCGAVGAVMAAETIKLIVGVGRSLRGRMLILDALDQTWREVEIRPQSARE